MRPKVNHWVVVGWLDTEPEVGYVTVATSARTRCSLVFFPRTGEVEEVDWYQILSVLGKGIPRVPRDFQNTRLKPEPLTFHKDHVRKS